MTERYDYDWIVIGSGFGGSVAALRLAEKGYRVLVLESGRRFRDEDFATSTWDTRRYFFAPKLGCRGIMRMSLFRDIFIVSGAGVGGGSLGYANTLYRARRSFFEDPGWGELADWESELAPHYDTAERMLGVTDVTFDTDADLLLKEMAEDFGVGDTYRHTRVGVYFGENGVEHPDPYFDGEGPAAQRLHALRAVHGRLPAQREEHAREELPVVRREARRAGRARPHRRPTCARSAPPTGPAATR